MHKFNLAYWRNPGYNFLRIFVTFITSWIYAAVYWRQGRVSLGRSGTLRFGLAHGAVGAAM